MHLEASGTKHFNLLSCCQIKVLQRPRLNDKLNDFSRNEQWYRI